MLVVIDTNILVSALWSRNSNPAKIVSMILRGVLVPCFDYRIITEYREVLKRPGFGFSEGEINSLLGWFESNGHSVVAKPSDIDFTDEADKMFYEVAKHCGAVLITGNLKHFPKDRKILNAADFLKEYADSF